MRGRDPGADLAPAPRHVVVPRTPAPLPLTARGGPRSERERRERLPERLAVRAGKEDGAARGEIRPGRLRVRGQHRPPPGVCVERVGEHRRCPRIAPDSREDLDVGPAARERARRSGRHRARISPRRSPRAGPPGPTACSGAGRGGAARRGRPRGARRGARGVRRSTGPSRRVGCETVPAAAERSGPGSTPSGTRCTSPWRPPARISSARVWVVTSTASARLRHCRSQRRSACSSTGRIAPPAEQQRQLGGGEPPRLVEEYRPARVREHGGTHQRVGGVDQDVGVRIELALHARVRTPPPARAASRGREGPAGREPRRVTRYEGGSGSAARA